MPPKQKFKPIFEEKKRKAIDPRFEDYAGNYNADLAKKSYSFITEVQQNEANELKKNLKKKRMNEKDREILVKNYNRITSDIRANEIRSIEKGVKTEFKKKGFKPKRKQFKE